MQYIIIKKQSSLCGEVLLEGVGQVLSEGSNGALVGGSVLGNQCEHGNHGHAAVLDLLDLVGGQGGSVLGEACGRRVGGGQHGRVEGEKKRGGEDGGWLVKAMREQGEKGGGVGCFAAVREDTVERCKLQEECRQDAFGGIQWSSAVRGVKHSPRGSKAPPG